jgi:hypothetical protein
MSGFTPQKTFSQQELDRMAELTSGLETKAAKIRVLADAGLSRSDTAAYLGLSYQHVRNVLARRQPPPTPSGAPAPGSAAAPPPMGVASVDSEGRVALPREVLSSMRVTPNSVITWRFDDDEFTLMGRRAGLRFVQDFVARKSGGDKTSWSDELIRERREEAAREDEDESSG